MASFSPLQFLLVVVFSLCTLIHAGEVVIGGFRNNDGMTGCTSDPTRLCVDNENGDTCYKVRGLDFSFTECNACMPKNYRNVATYQHPYNLPCALWRMYDCDNLFVSYVWQKSGSNACMDGGQKSYNILDGLDNAAQTEQEFIQLCRQARTVAHYRLPPITRIINERDFCYQYKNNITITMADGSQSSYKTYYEQKYGTSKN